MYEELIESYKNRKFKLSKKNIDFYNYIVAKTAFLPEDASSTQRLWHFHNNTFHIPLCIHCNKNATAWDNTRTKSYRRFCSKECAVQHKRDNPTCIYGDPPLCKAEGCTNKVHTKGPNGWRETCSPECGLQYIKSLRVPYEEMMKFVKANDPSLPLWQTLKPKNPAMFNTIMEHTTNLPKFYQITERVRWLRGELSTKVEQYAQLEKQQQAFISQTPPSLCHYCGIKPVRASAVRRLTYGKYCSDVCETSHKKAVAIGKLIRTIKRIKLSGKYKQPPHNKNLDPRLNDPEWLIDQHHNKCRSITDIADELGVWYSTVVSRFEEFDLSPPITFHGSSSGERELATWISEVLAPEEVICNSRKIIAPRELDIFIPSCNIAIEYCGLYWHSSCREVITSNYHKDKLLRCNDKGINLITIFEDEWIYFPSVVKERIKYALLTQSDCYQLDNLSKYKCSQISKDIGNSFMESFNLNGLCKTSTCYGVYNSGGILVAVGTFSNSSKTGWVMSGFAYVDAHDAFCSLKIIIDTFKHCTANSQFTIMNDLRWNMSNTIIRLGGKLISSYRPDYTFANMKQTRREDKHLYSSDRLKLIMDFNPAISNAENCKSLNLYQIWDCGSEKYII